MEIDDCRVPRSLWAKEVKRFSGNKCEYCGKQEKIEAHHIVPKCVNPELEFDLTNGIALCHECHVRAHGGYYSLTRHYNENPPEGLRPYYQDVIDFVNSFLVIFVPAGRKKDIEAYAASKGQTVNGLVNDLLKNELGMTEAEWKRKPGDSHE